MKKSLIALLLLFFAFATTTVAQKANDKASDLKAQVPVDKKVRVGHLDNGFTYYIRANKKPENRIQFRLVTNAGSVLEDDDQQGLAHFTEHMAFNGTTYFPSNTVISRLQEKGVEFGRDINAYTSFDETVFYVNMPADQPELVEMGFQILDGWAGKLTFDEKEIEEERGVIIEEWRGGKGASERLREKTWPVMFAGSKYVHRLPIGLENIIRTAPRSAFTRFYNDWYRPDLQAIIIVGDIDVNMAEAKIKQYFGAYAKRDNPRERPYYDIPGNKEPLVCIALDKEATSGSIQMMWKQPKAATGTIGNYRESLVRSLINGMISDRFDELCQKSTCPAIGAGAGYGGLIGRKTDAFFVSAMPKENRIEEATQFVLNELIRIQQHGFLPTELERQKEDLLSRYQRMAKEVNKTDNNSFASEYTNNFLEGEVIPGIRQENAYAKEFVPGITIDEVNNMVAKWITEENFVYIFQGPEKEGYKVPTEDAIKKIYADFKNIKTEPWIDTYKDLPLWDKNLPEVKPVASKEVKGLGATEYTLPNGIRFVVKKTEFKADEIRIASFADGGLSIYEDKEAYLAGNAASFIDEGGIADFSNTDLGKKLKGMTLSISPSVSELRQGFNGTCSPKDLETTLQLVNLYYTAPRKDKDVFEKNIDAMKTQYKFAGENIQVVLFKKYYETAFPNDHRTTILPTDEQINSLDLDRMYQIFKERYTDASNQIFFFVGNVSDEQIALIAKYLNNLPTNGKQKGEKHIDRSVDMAPGVNHGVCHKGTDPQALMLISGQTELKSLSLKERATITALGQALSMTTLEIIREKKGLAYSPYATADFDLEPKVDGSWMFFISTNPEKTSEVEAAALDIVKSYVKKGANKKTLAKVLEQMVRQREQAMQENGFWMGQLQGAYIYGEDRNEWVNNYAEIVKSITNNDIKAMAKRIFDLNHYTVITLLPEETK